MGKINANNLSYDKKLPPFLAALRGQLSDQRGDGPDPILASHRRAAKPRSRSEEAEDAPLVLDEHGDVVAGVTVGVDGAATMKRTATDAENEGEEAKKRLAGGTGDASGQDEGVAGIGAGTGKKRRLGKAVGGGDSDEEEGINHKKQKRLAAGRASPDEKKDVKDSQSKADGRGPAKPKKKKAKAKVKLSFEEDEEDEG